MKRTRVGAAVLAMGLLGVGCDVYEGDISGMYGGLAVFAAGVGEADFCETDSSVYLDTETRLEDDFNDVPLLLDSEQVSSELAASNDPRLEGATKIDLETTFDLEEGLGAVHGDLRITDDGQRRFDGDFSGTMIGQVISDVFLLGFVNGHIDGQVKPMKEIEGLAAASEESGLPGGTLESDFVGLYMAFPEGITDSAGEVGSLHNGAVHSDVASVLILTLGEFSEGFIGGLSTAEEEAAVDQLLGALPKEISAEIDAEDIDIDDFFSTNGSAWFRPDEHCFDFEEDEPEADAPELEKTEAPKAPKPERTPEVDEDDRGDSNEEKDLERLGASEVEAGPDEAVVIVEETASPLE